MSFAIDGAQTPSIVFLVGQTGRNTNLFIYPGGIGITAVFEKRKGAK